MPKQNEIRKGRDIGKKPFAGNFIWIACPACGNERWVYFVKSTQSPLYSVRGCRKCMYKNRKKQRRNGFKDELGYKYVSLPKEHPFYEMVNTRGWVFEHRLIMANHLGRALMQNEIVHHLNGIKTDNRIENLEVMTASEHLGLHLGKKSVQRIQDLERTVKVLEARIKILESKIKSPQADCFSPAEVVL